MHIRDANAHAPPSASLVGAGQAGAEDEPDAADLEQLGMGWAPPAGAADPAPEPEAKPKRATPRPKATQERFDRFWNVYPLRKGKARALERFLKLTPEDAELAIEGARKYAAECVSKGVEERYIKYPEGWLNARRFEDDQRAISAQHDPDVRIVNGKLELLNGKKVEWLAKFKTEDELDLALIRAKGRIKPNLPLLDQVEGELASILLYRSEADARAKAKLPPGKVESLDEFNRREAARTKRILALRGLDEGDA